jgi:hypothetical protein
MDSQSEDFSDSCSDELESSPEFGSVGEQTKRQERAQPKKKEVASILRSRMIYVLRAMMSLGMILWMSLIKLNEYNSNIAYEVLT